MTRFTNSSNPVQYDRNHPFKIICRRRLAEKNGYPFSHHEEKEHQTFLKRHLSPWDRFRIWTNAYSYRLKISNVGKSRLCCRDWIFGDWTFTMVKNAWSSALRVYPVTNNLVVASKSCPISGFDQNSTGIPNTDFVVYIAANIESICSVATEPLVSGENNHFFARFRYD